MLVRWHNSCEIWFSNISFQNNLNKAIILIWHTHAAVKNHLSLENITLDWIYLISNIDRQSDNQWHEKCVWRNPFRIQCILFVKLKKSRKQIQVSQKWVILCCIQFNFGYPHELLWLLKMIYFWFEFYLFFLRHNILFIYINHN